MPLIKKSPVRILKFVLLNIVVLFSTTAKAELLPLQQANSLDIGQSQKIVPTKDNIHSKSLSVFDSPTPTQVAVDAVENGTPSLRREPSGGEKFEPKRIPLTVPFREKPYRASPSITIINPSGYGASWGSGGVGLGFQERARFTEQSDGVFGVGFGLGNSQKNVGAQVGISLVDLSAPFRDGAINLKLHRRLPEDFAIAAGVQGLITWGDTDGGSSAFGVATKRFKLRKDRTKAFSEIFTTVGLGGGQFRSEFDINEGNETVGVFGSLAVKIIQPVGLVTEWTGQDLTVGIPLIPFRRLPDRKSVV